MPRFLGAQRALYARSDAPVESETVEEQARHSVFGPLNGVRTVLVVGAAVAALIAAAFGQWVVTVVLAVGIAAHGLLWGYLWRNREQTDDGELEI